MENSEPNDETRDLIPRLVAGRFVVRLRGETANGIDVDAALRLLETRRDEIEQIFVIHRVTEDGHLELAGIDKGSLTRRDCMLFSRDSVAGARRDYDQLVGYAQSNPPPCRIEMRFGHAKSLAPSHVVVLIYPQACQSAVGGWLSQASFQPGDSVAGSPDALAEFESAGPQIVLSTTLLP